MDSLKMFLLALFTICSTPIIAHSGHGYETNSFWHYVLSPTHLVLVVLASALIYLAVKVKTNKKQRDA